MPPKKQPKLSLNSTESEPSIEPAKSAKKTRAKKELSSSKAEKSAKPARPLHVPKEWGAPGEGGYFSFQKEYLAQKQDQLGEKFVRKDEMTAAGAAWKEKDPKWKWQTYGAAPPAPQKPPSEYPPGNFLKFQAEFRAKQKEAGKEEAEKKEWNVMAKAKWDKMSEKDKSVYAIILTEEEKAERAAKREKKKADKAAAKVEEKKEKRAKSAKAAKSSKVEHDADSDKQPQRKKSATPKKSTKTAATKASKLSLGSNSAGDDESEGLTAREAQFKKAWEQYKDLDGFDVSIRLLMPDGKLKMTTFAKQMKGLKVALVINTASKCGNTKKHFKEMAELQTKFGDKGFSVLAFPSPSFSQEPLKATEIRSWAEEQYNANFPMFEPILVNGKAAHPIYQRLKETARGGKGLDNIKFNYDKFLVTNSGKGGYQVIDYADSKKKPAAYADEIEMLLK